MVIAIIAILAALLLPVLGKAKDSAMRTRCMNNLKQTAMAMEAYNGDNTQFPARSKGGATGYTSDVFMSSWNGFWDLRPQIAPYIGDFSIYTCPNMAHDGVKNIDDPSVWRTWGTYATYSYFADIQTPQFGKMGVSTPKSSQDATNPATFPLVQDRLWYPPARDRNGLYNHGPGSFGAWGSNHPAAATISGLTPQGAAISFYDGHAGWYGFTALDDVGAITANGSHQLHEYSVQPDW